ncbi:hypothetical protein F5883DRAFT_69101 [Diaporthe sp. PMI_573]|nr:hypothetical protein F5883DRAFT_69101 [Diaporthaceae sp. PMI_573]
MVYQCLLAYCLFCSIPCLSCVAGITLYVCISVSMYVKVSRCLVLGLRLVRLVKTLTLTFCNRAPCRQAPREIREDTVEVPPMPCLALASLCVAPSVMSALSLTALFSDDVGHDQLDLHPHLPMGFRPYPVLSQPSDALLATNVGFHGGRDTSAQS